MTTPPRTTAEDDRSTAGAPATRPSSARLLVVGGSACVIAGGIVAAATGPLRLDSGSWLAAYLVLVCGVGSYAIGTMQTRPGSPLIPSTWDRVRLAGWILGNVAVITGSLTAATVVVDAGVVALLIALVIALVDDVRPSRRPGRWPSRDEIARRPVRGFRSWLTVLAYRCLLVLLIISAPVGAVLAYVRAA